VQSPIEIENASLGVRQFEELVLQLSSAAGTFSFSFMPAFPLESVAGTATLGGHEIPHGQQQSQIVRRLELSDYSII